MQIEGGLSRDLGSAIDEILQSCLEDGMKPPLIACAVSPNGSVLAVRFPSSESEVDILATHFEAQKFAGPVTIIVLDQKNEAARHTIEHVASH